MPRIGNGILMPSRGSRLCGAAQERCTASGTRMTPSLLRRLLAVSVALGRAGQDLFGDQTGVLADRRLDLRGHVGIGLEEGFRVLAALPQPLAVIGEPGAGFLDNAGLDAEIE